MKTIRLVALSTFALASLLVGCVADGTNDDAEDTATTEEALNNPTTVAVGQIGGLVESTGNLYWTANSFADPGTWGAAVHRGAKGQVPGQETTLASETSASTMNYGDITFANPGTFYGYFVANYGAVSQIKRVPLAGGPTITLATSPATIGGRQTLKNDGTFLYWADAGGVRKMALGGGAITTLVATGSNVTALGLDFTDVYYAQGTSVRSVPKAGGVATTVGTSTTGTAINALFVQPGTLLFWGEESGAVVRQVVGGAPQIRQPAAGGLHITSISFDGSHELWTRCTTNGNSICSAFSKIGVNAPVSVSAGVGAAFIQGDATGIFFGNLSQLSRATY